MFMLDCTEIKVQNELVVFFFFRLPAHFDHYIPDHLIKNVTVFENVIRTNFFQKQQIEEIPKKQQQLPKQMFIYLSNRMVVTSLIMAETFNGNFER